jgi:hypothetical protein
MVTPTKLSEMLTVFLKKNYEIVTDCNKRLRVYKTTVETVFKLVSESSSFLFTNLTCTSSLV